MATFIYAFIHHLSSCRLPDSSFYFISTSSFIHALEQEEQFFKHCLE